MVIIAKTPGSKVTNEEDGDYGNLTQDENNKSHHPLVEIVQTPGGQFVKTPSSNKNNSARIHNGGKVNFQSGNGNRNGNVKQSIKNKTSNH
uniref:Uncharacterized protein n=1 Tax=Panagrolaimus davidi TaxID=227884 RepID=A0A914PF64_9BILA